MKKLFIISMTLTLFAANTSAATYVLYYQSTPNGMWSKGGTYYDFNTCMNAVKYSYSWAHDARCNSE